MNPAGLTDARSASSYPQKKVRWSAFSMHHLYDFRFFERSLPTHQRHRTTNGRISNGAKYLEEMAQTFTASVIKKN
ncbi:MAG: hypothetical protein AAF960_17965 [Bacteroidota bacterium]